jgi:phosphonate transport system substrate-binding protein
VYIGVISRFAPNVIFNGYQPIMDYLNRNGTRHYALKLSTSYQDAVEDLRQGEVAASFLGAWIYAHLDADKDLVPLAAPLNASGRSDFHAILVTRPDTGIESVGDLAGRSVALPSADSWSGNWLQSAGLPAVGLSAADLDTIRHFDHHQTVVWQVLRGRFDAGVVKESVAERYRSEGLVAIAHSEPIPGPPLVGNRLGRREVLDEIAELLLRLDPAVPADRAVLDTWSNEFSDGFTVVDAARYHDAFRPGVR